MYTTTTDQFDCIVQMLTSLEYGGPKEEREITERLLQRYGYPALKKENLAKKLVNNPGFEQFFLDVFTEVKPFALMLKEVYELLSSYNTTAERRASIFKISSEIAETVFDFDMSSFPKEELRIISEIESFIEVMEFQYGNENEKEAPFDWYASQTFKLWEEVSPRWDGDFYDNGFHRLLSYAKTITPADSKERKKIEELVTPILDRLKGVCGALTWDELEISADRLKSISNSTINIKLEKFQLHTYESQAFRLYKETILTYLNHVLREEFRRGVPLSGPKNTYVWDEVQNVLLGLAVSIHFWEEGKPRLDNRQWLADRFKKPVDEITPKEFLVIFEPYLQSYVNAMDSIMPVISKIPTFRMAEIIMEFLQLPYWKDRWFLYEIWTLTRTLNMARTNWPVTLTSLFARQDGIIEWQLAGATAPAPVAKIGKKGEVEVWTQRLTKHPVTGKGLEPDLRFTRATDERPDLIIVENKDRRKPSKGDMTEILDRYVTGTKAKYVALINYDNFTGPTHALGSRHPDRNIEILSNFRPSKLPFSFTQNFFNVLEEVLGEPLRSMEQVEKDENHEKKDINISKILVELTWEKSPADLDLHAWIIRGGKHHHVCYANPKVDNTEAFAWLNDDVKTSPGKEFITILGAKSDTTWIAVHAFSEGQVSEAKPRVRIEGLTSKLLELEIATHHKGRWWHLIKIEEGKLTMLNKVFNDPPIED